MYLSAALTLLSTTTNYSVTNMPNLYNFLISVLRIIKDENDRNFFIEEMRLELGITFFEGFRGYVLKKYPYEHEFSKLVNAHVVSSGH